MTRYAENDVKEYLIEREEPQSVGVLSDVDIKKAICDRDIFIYPYDERCLTSIGYNFCPSEIIISTKTGLPMEVKNHEGEKYVTVSPHDTILVSTREYLSTGAAVMGTFHSRVAVVSAGFGHISTTLDPLWKGPLLIALNNPGSRKLKLVISKENHPIPFVTLIFYRMAEDSEKKHDNPPYRTDIFQQYMAKPGFIKKVLLGKAYTNYESMVELIQQSMDLKRVPSSTNDLLKELEDKISSVKRAFERGGTGIVQLIAAGNDLASCVEKVWNCNGISKGLYEALCYLYEAIGYFYADGNTWDNQEYSLDTVFDNYLENCYSRLQDEKIGQYWRV